MALEHRFSTFFEAATTFIKMKLRSHPFVQKIAENLQKQSDFALYSFFQLLFAIHRTADSTIENPQSYFHTLLLIRNKPIEFFVAFSEIIRSYLGT